MGSLTTHKTAAFIEIDGKLHFSQILDGGTSLTLHIILNVKISK